jgi:hypothetical protein
MPIDPISLAIGVGAASDVIGGIAGFGASRSAAKQAKRLAINQGAHHQYGARREPARMRLQRDQQVGQAKAVAGAANIMIDRGSAGRFINEMSNQWQSDMSYMRRRAQIEAEKARLGGQATAANIRADGIGSLLGSVSSAANYALLKR